MGGSGVQGQLWLVSEFESLEVKGERKGTDGANIGAALPPSIQVGAADMTASSFQAMSAGYPGVDVTLPRPIARCKAC